MAVDKAMETQENYSIEIIMPLGYSFNTVTLLKL